MTIGDSDDIYVPEVVDGRYSTEFYRRLQDYLGPPDPVDPGARRFHLSWWRDHAGERASFLRQKMLPALQRAGPIAGLRICDFGCGTGSSCVVLAEAGAVVVGVDP